MAKTLVLLSGAFPYQSGEEFLVEETKFYGQFDKVHIFPTEAYTYVNEKKIYSSNVIVHRVNKARSGKIQKACGCIKNLFLPETITEIRYLKQTGRLSLYSLRQLLVYQYMSERQTKLIDNCLERILHECSEEDIVIYCYWLSINAKIALHFKKKYRNIRIVSRCHGGDLYEYRYPSDYLPFRREIMSQFDCIYAISENGKAYLDERYREFNPKVKVSRLGTPPTNISFLDIMNKESVLRIVSCSYCRRLKRIDKIIEALSTITGIEIEWTHIGAGDEYEKLKELAKHKLPGNIKCIFEGYMPNDKILYLYQEKQFHAFVNVSETEGVPVSIMEALSCGIPIIATNVGGVSEMVKDQYNGFLLRKDFEINELKDLIVKMFSMEQDTYVAMRENAYKMWDDCYNSTKNYQLFIEDLLKI